jgi:hypothetical protein
LKGNDVLHEHFVGCLVVESFSGAVIEFFHRPFNFCRRQLMKITLFGEVLPE